MSDTKTDYLASARGDAATCASYYLDEIVEQIGASFGNGQAGDNLLDDSDYPGGDAYHHQCHVDREYSLLEAAELLDQLRDHEETDRGLWEGLEPRQAIAAQAAFTYGNAVCALFGNLIEHINDCVADLDEPSADTVRQAVVAAIDEWVKR